MGVFADKNEEPFRVVLEIRATYESYAEANKAADRLQPLLDGAISTEVVIYT